MIKIGNRCFVDEEKIGFVMHSDVSDAKRIIEEGTESGNVFSTIKPGQVVRSVIVLVSNQVLLCSLTPNKINLIIPYNHRSPAPYEECLEKDNTFIF